MKWPNLTVLSLYCFTSFGTASLDCLDMKGDLVPVENTKVLEWKHSTANQFQAHTHVQGVLVRNFPDTPRHKHFEIRIGESTDDTLEVVYNTDFGRLPYLVKGMAVEACGDYITSNSPTPNYPASPDGAIIHWVHKSRNLSRHESGFLAIDNIPYGL